MAGNNIILQKRDIEMLKAVYSYRFLTRDQLMKLFGFNTVSCINTRLRKLCQANYLERSFLPIAIASCQGVYTLGRKGVDVVSNSMSIEKNEVKHLRHKNGKLKEFTMLHHIQTNDVRIAFSNCVDTRIVRWDYEPQISIDTKRKLRPDAFFQVLYNDMIYSFFLETDRGTETIRRFVDTKVSRYLSMIKNNIHKQMFGINYFAVLVVVKSKTRLMNLYSAISKKVNGVFWFVEREYLSSESVAKAVFIKLGDRHRRSLFRGDSR